MLTIFLLYCGDNHKLPILQYLLITQAKPIVYDISPADLTIMVEGQGANKSIMLIKI